MHGCRVGGTLGVSHNDITCVTQRLLRRYRYTKLAPGQHGGLQHSGPLPRDGFLDGDLLLQFGNLSRPMQREVAKEAGTSVEEVVGHLRDVLLSGG